MKLTVTIKDKYKIQKNFDAFYEDMEKRINEVSDITSADVEAEAKRLAPYDMGKLRQNIAWQKPIKRIKGVIQNIISAYMPYSAYQEFGTGGDVDIPPGWEKIAIKFKGAGKRTINMKPQPFLYPAFAKAKIQFPKDIKFVVDYLTKKYSK